MSIENLAADMLGDEPEKRRPEEKKPETVRSIEDDIFNAIQWVYSEIKRLERNVADSKKAKLENLAGFQEELSAAKRELFKEWGKLLKLAVEKRVPTPAESAVLRENRLAAMDKAVEAAQGAGVRLEDVPAAFLEAERAVLEHEPLDVAKVQTTEFQARGMKLRERERLLREARFWLKKATIIQSLIEAKTSAEGGFPALEGLRAESSKISEHEPLEQFIADMKYFEMVEPENDFKWRVLSDLRWQQGAAYGKPRSGHPEGKNIFHVVEVLHNVEKLQNISEHEREQLRLIALIHDSFKQQVDRSKPRVGENHHGMIARRFAEKYTQDEVVLKIIQLHDEAFNAWRRGHESGDWEKAEKRLRSLITNLGEENLRLYTLFYQCDNETGTKEQESVQWFKEHVKEL